MKVYTQTFDLAQPTLKAFSVAQYSDFGIGIKIVKNGVEVEDAFTLEKDGVTLTPEADKIAGYTVYLLTADGAANYTVTCNGQTFTLTQGVTDSTVIDYKPVTPEPEPATKYGATIDNLIGDVVDGQLQAPASTFAFECDEITSITPSTQAFSSFKGNVSYMSLPNLTTIGSGAGGFDNVFNGMTNLSAVNLPSLSVVGENGMMREFQNCTNLTAISLPAMTNISGMYSFMYAFNGCTKLEHVAMQNLTAIGVGGAQYAFNGCTSLKTVDFAKVSTFGQQGVDYMFKGCTSLQIVNFSEATAVPYDATSNAKQVMFQNTNDTFKVIVPDALYASWIANGYWSSMSAQITKVSDYAAIITDYNGADNMDN